MTIKDICSLIPDDVRRERLLTTANPIQSATLSMSDPNMVILVQVWETFVEPQKEVANCPICLGGIRTNFRQMYDTLIELEENHQKLDMI